MERKQELSEAIDHGRLIGHVEAMDRWTKPVILGTIVSSCLVGGLSGLAGSYLTKPTILVKKDVDGNGITDYVVTNRIGDETVFYNNGESEYQPIPSEDLAKQINRLPVDYEPFRVEYNFEE